MLLGHKIQWEFLKRLAQNNQIPHAMIFFGQNSLGKKKIAFEFIKLLNCENLNQRLKGAQTDSCQTCLSCKLIEAKKHPDVIFIEPTHISQIRDLQNRLSLKPQMSSFKSVIIDQSDNLNFQAQNCLLKTLEEPKGKTLLILIVSNIENLLKTICSRCQILKFYPVSFSEISKEYSGKTSNSDREKMFLLSQGRPGEIVNFLQDSQKFFLSIKNFQEAEKILNSNLFERFCFAQKFFKKGEEQEFSNNLNQLLEVFEKYLKLVLLKKVGSKDKSLDCFDLKLPENYSIIKIKRTIELVQDLKKIISQTNVNPKLAFENLMIKM